MTPAERARKIEQLEFERECQQARLRAQRYAEQRRQEERRRLNAWLDRPEEPVTHKVFPGKKSKLYTHNGQSKTLNEWASIARVSYRTLSSRIRSGMDFERAVTMRPREKAEKHTINGVSKTLAEWAKHAGCTYNTLIARMSKGKRTLTEAVAMSAVLPTPKTRAGVVFKLHPFSGTGAGGTAQEPQNITFPDSEVSQ